MCRPRLGPGLRQREERDGSAVVAGRWREEEKADPVLKQGTNREALFDPADR